MKHNQIIVKQDNDATSYQMLLQVIHDACDQIRHDANLIDQGNNGVLIIQRYRMTITTTHSILWMFKEQLGYEPYDFINHSLKYLATHFSKVRMMDIIMQMYHDSKRYLDLNNNALFDIINQLQSDARMHALSTFDRKLPYLVINEIKKVMTSPEVISKMEYLDVKKHVNQVINALIKQEGEQRGLAYNHVLKTDDYRMLIEKISDAIQVFKPLVASEYREQLETFKQLSDDLELIRDVTTLHQTLEPIDFEQAQDDVLSFLVFMDIKSKQMQHKLFL